MIWSCFQNIMGEAYVDDNKCPGSAIVYVNCFVFAGGKPNEQLVQVDFVQGYPSYEDYQKYGLGFVIYRAGEMVAGVSSYSSYKDGIEIEIDTKEEYRRKGLATACGAKLILECLKRGLYPSWDAQNRWSVSLAEKLGYHYSHTYTAYEMWKEI